MNPNDYPHYSPKQHDELTPWSSYDQIIIENLLLEPDTLPPTPLLFAPTYDGGHRLVLPLEAPHFYIFARRRQTDEERRLRHQASQQRFIQRKKDTIEKMKRLVQELEQKSQLLEIEAEKKRLKKENQQLATQLGTATAPIPTRAQIAMLLEEKLSMVRRHFEPLDVATWTRTLRKNVREFDESRNDTHFVTSGLSIMGWRDLRKVEKETLTFVLSKEFPNTDAEDLMNRTYSKLTSLNSYARFFNPFFNVKMQVLQRINDDNIIIHRAMFVPHTRSIVHGLVMISRVCRDEGFLIIGRALENNPVQQRLGLAFYWTDVTTWLEFLPSHVVNEGSNGCIYRSGGKMRHIAVKTAAYWLMEVFFMALRFESDMIAPVFCITSE